MLQRRLCVEPTCHYKSAYNHKVLKLWLAVCETNCVCVIMKLLQKSQNVKHMLWMHLHTKELYIFWKFKLLQWCHCKNKTKNCNLHWTLIEKQAWNHMLVRSNPQNSLQIYCRDCLRKLGGDAGCIAMTPHVDRFPFIKRRPVLFWARSKIREQEKSV